MAIGCCIQTLKLKHTFNDRRWYLFDLILYNDEFISVKK